MVSSDWSSFKKQKSNFEKHFREFLGKGITLLKYKYNYP